VIDGYEDGIITNAMTREHARQYTGAQTLIGFGAIFHRRLIDGLMDPKWERDALFYREADRIFTALNTYKMVFPEIEILPRASDEERMWRQPEHIPMKNEINMRIFALTGRRS
jgi:hypothetical protein